MIDSAEIDDRIAKCEKLLAADPNSQIFAALAEVYRKKGDLQKAQEVCTQGLKVHPNYSSARVVLAKILVAREDYDRAWDELKEAAATSGRTRAIDILESEILIHRGQKSAAAAILHKLYATDPKDDNVRNLMALMEGDRTSAATSDVEIPLQSMIRPTKNFQREISLSSAISILKVMPRVLGVLAVDNNGLVLDGRFDGIYTKEEIAALSKGIYDSVISGASRIDLGPTREILVETLSSKLWIFFKEKYLLVVLTRDDASMGALKLKIDDLFQNVDRHGNEVEAQ